MCVLFHKFTVHFCHSKETKQPVISQVLRTWNTIVKARFRSEESPRRFLRRKGFTVKVFPLPILIPSALNIHTFINPSMDGKLIWRNSSETSAHLTPKHRHTSLQNIGTPHSKNEKEKKHCLRVWENKCWGEYKNFRGRK